MADSVRHGLPLRRSVADVTEPHPSSEDSLDPWMRPVGQRRASRVVVVDPDGYVLMFRDSDPGIPGVHWWITPGGGVDAGESAAQAAVREVAEETGLIITEADLIGPVARRTVIHGYSDRITIQAEDFFVVRTPRFVPTDVGYTDEEREKMVGVAWIDPDLGQDEPVWPAGLGELLALLDDAQEWPVDLGLTEESTLPVR